MAGEDFVYVQLSSTAQKAGRARVTAGRCDLIFTAGEPPQRLTRAYEWDVILSHQRFEGQPMFELVPARPAASAIVPVAPPVVDGAQVETSAADAAQEKW